MAYSDYWKYEFDIPDGLKSDCIPILDNKALCMGDSLFVFTLTDTLLPYIKENFKDINGVHITPLMLEKEMTPFKKNLESLVDWMIYDDDSKKFVDNLLVVAPLDDIYKQAFPICDKQVYITKWDKRWPVGNLTCLKGDLSMLNGSFSVSSNYYYWITFSKHVSREITTSTVIPPGYDPLDPSSTAPDQFIYEGDLYIKDQTDEESSDSSEGATTPVTWSKHVDITTLSFNMNKMFSNRIGSLSTGAELGMEVLSISYKSRPDETGIPID